jgi:predicted outer membrane repeat protein
VLLLAATALGATLTVGSSGLAQYADLASAVSAAADGDRIELEAGTYAVNVTIDKALQIVGAGSSDTILDGTGASTTLTASLSGTQVLELSMLKLTNTGGRGLVLSGGELQGTDLRFSGGDATLEGGCLYATGTTLTLTDSIFSACTGSDGGAIRVQGGVFTFDGLEVLSSRANRGGALFAYGARVFLSASTFDSNSAYDGGGAFYAEMSTSTLSSNAWNANSSSLGPGGAIWAAPDGATNSSGDSFSGNSASTTGGAVFANAEHQFVAHGATFSANSAASGGALACDDALVTLSGNSFLDNRAANGGALAASICDDLTDASSTFSGNEVESSGGAVYFSMSSGTFTGTIFDTNIAGAANGGGLAATSDSQVATDSCIFTGNYAYNGGHVGLWSDAGWTDNGSTLDGGISYAVGGAVYASASTTLSLTSTAFTANTSSYSWGGALWQDTTGNMTLSGVNFTNNLAYSWGGAIATQYTYGTATVSDSTFSGNSSTYGDGGAIAMYGYSNLAVSGTSFESNEAYSHGGAISSYYATDLAVTSSTFSGNYAAYNGGAVHYWPYAGYGGELSFTDSVVTQNLAGYQGGGLSSLGADSAVISGVRFVSNAAGGDSFGGGIYLGGTGSAELSNVELLGNTAGYGGGIYADYGTGAASWTNLLFAENLAGVGGGACLVSNFESQITNATFFANGASEEAGDLCLYEDAAEIVNVIFTDTSSGAAVTGWGPYAGAASFYHSLFWNNAGGTVTGEEMPLLVGPGLIQADPLLIGASADGDFENDSWAPARGSPCIDAGMPSITDLDGTISDIGYTGGPGFAAVDADGDGFDTTSDCNDHDAAVGPGASDAPYDSLDSDCDGSDDDDLDGDGVAGTPAGGTDCDDADPTVTDDCSAPARDGGEEGEEGCGCASGSAGAGLGGVVLGWVAARKQELLLVVAAPVAPDEGTRHPLRGAPAPLRRRGGVGPVPEGGGLSAGACAGRRRPPGLGFPRDHRVPGRAIPGRVADRPGRTGLGSMRGGRDALRLLRAAA